MKLLKKILMTFIWIILILLVTFNIYNFVSIKLLHKELPKIFGYSILEVVSGSMEPTIMVGDLIVIDTDCGNYQKGDIITFRDVNGSFVTHRILEIGIDEMITKGDNNDSQDEAMSPATIVGKYVTRIPQLGSVMSSLKNPLVMALILAIGIIICFLVSTDKDLKPKLTEEEKEFLEFKKFKEEKKQQELKIQEEIKAERVEEENTPKKEINNSSQTKKNSNSGNYHKRNNTNKNYSQSRKKNTSEYHKTQKSSNNKSKNSYHKKTNSHVNNQNKRSNNYSNNKKKTSGTSQKNSSK